MPHANVHEHDQGTSAAAQPGVDGMTIRLSHDMCNAVNASYGASTNHKCSQREPHLCLCSRCTPAALAMRSLKLVPCCESAALWLCSVWGSYRSCTTQPRSFGHHCMPPSNRGRMELSALLLSCTAAQILRQAESVTGGVLFGQRRAHWWATTRKLVNSRQCA